MRSQYILILIGLVLVFGAYIIFNNKSSTAIQNTTNVETGLEKNRAYEAKTDKKGAVEVRVTPETLKPNSEVKFEVVLETHSIPLDFDLTKISKLTDDKNINYQATS